MQVHPSRSHTFDSGYTSSYTSTASKSTNRTSVGSGDRSHVNPHVSNPALSAAKHSAAAGRLRGRTYTHSDPTIDEGFFSAPPSPFVTASTPAMCESSTEIASPTFSQPQHTKGRQSTLHTMHASQAKAKIKPLWKIATGNARASGNSLDLSQPGGGEAARNLGLGIYGSDDPYGSGYDDIEPVPRHRRGFSSTSSGGWSPTTSTGVYSRTGQYIHPRRQIPRPYTPTNQNSGDEDSSEDDDTDEFGSRGYYSGEYSRGNSLDYSRPRVSGLRIRTDSAYSSPMIRTATTINSHTSGSPITPITPITTSHTSSGLLRPSARHSTLSGATARDQSPSFAASVTAARLAWDAKEAHKEEKREKKRRKSEQREREKAERRSSKDVPRPLGSVWDESQGEKVEYEDEPPQPPPPQARYHSRSSTPNVGTGRKWGVQGTGGAAWAPKRKRPGLKQRWLGFVVWIRFGLVKMGRKFGGMKKRKS